MRKQHNIEKRAKKLVTGLIVRWSDANPLQDGDYITPQTITHKKPLLKIYARRIFNEYREFIFVKTCLRWRVLIEVIFLYPNGMEQREQRELLAHCRLSELNEHCIEAIADANKYGENNQTTEFTVECLGL